MCSFSNVFFFFSAAASAQCGGSHVTWWNLMSLPGIPPAGFVLASLCHTREGGDVQDFREARFCFQFLSYPTTVGWYCGRSCGRPQPAELSVEIFIPCSSSSSSRVVVRSEDRGKKLGKKLSQNATLVSQLSSRSRNGLLLRGRVRRLDRGLSVVSTRVCCCRRPR